MKCRGCDSQAQRRKQCQNWGLLANEWHPYHTGGIERLQRFQLEQGCACRPNIGYSGALTLGAGSSLKKVTQNSRARISGWSVTANNEGTARTGRTKRDLGRDPSGSSRVMSRAICLSEQ